MSLSCLHGTILSHMWFGFPYVHGFTSSRMSKHWHYWNHCQDQGHNWGSTSYSLFMPRAYGIGKLTARGKSSSLWVMSPPISATLHHKQQNSSQRVMANMLREAQWQTLGRKSGPTKLVEEQFQPNKFGSLPTTSAAFLENVKCYHYQVCNWKSALLPHPPSTCPTEFGWKADIENKTLLARDLPDATALAPDYILKLIRCFCHSGVPCKAGNCSCLGNRPTCTVFCAWEGSRLCCNPYPEHTDEGLHMFDDADADFTVNWSLPIVENIVRDLISYQASWYFEGSKDIAEAEYYKSFSYENLVLWVLSVM